MKLSWYKILCILLLSYVFMAGMLIPLGPGILDATPTIVNSGEQVTVHAKTYNTAYTKEAEGQIAVRLRVNDTQALPATAVKATSDNGLDITFNIPAGKLPIDTTLETGKNRKAKMPLLEISAPISGYTSLESAFFVRDTTGQVASSNAFANVEAYPRTHRIAFPFLNMLEETIRNLYYHVPLWFGMMFVMFMSFIYSIRYLNGFGKNLNADTLTHYDLTSKGFAVAGVLYGALGLVTGAVWAKNTWGAYWSFDVKQNMAAVAMLIYCAYFVLRGSFEDEARRARLSAVYNIFAFAMLIPLLYIIPRIYNSLHPGADGNPAFKSYDLDSTMRFVFYPAVIAFILLGYWIAEITTRVEKLYAKDEF